MENKNQYKVEYINNKKSMYFGNYLVVEEKKNQFYGIYLNRILLTHKSSWRSATKIAKLLHEAYLEGYDDARDIYYY